MKFEVLRFSSQNESSLGALFDVTEGRKFLCFTLEDEARKVKVSGETRIPAGTYKLGLRTVGGFNEKYASRFPEIHKGMIHVLNVPNFEYILWHCGNDDEDTMGCLLLGDTSQQNISKEGFIGASSDAYKRVYPPIGDALANGEECEVTYIDYDTAIIQ
tara:strand:- start:34 stop:510 length:477 start_codon:yes stop_codon:yes gene_type:complete